MTVMDDDEAVVQAQRSPRILLIVEPGRSLTANGEARSASVNAAMTLSELNDSAARRDAGLTILLGDRTTLFIVG